MLLRFRKDEVLEEKTPNKVDPADDKAEESDKDRKNQRQNALRLEESRPSHDDFNKPVHDRDEKQDDLDEPALPVKPSGQSIILLEVSAIIVSDFRRLVKR